MSGKYLIVGLGNPGYQYAKTRHNLGFMVADEIARRHATGAFSNGRKALVVEANIAGKNVIIIKPQTYMNLSGEAVRAYVDFYKLPPEQIMVAYDELDLPLGTLRLRSNGGHGGQNGVRSVIQHLGTRDFARARCGIGRPPGRMKPKDFLLSNFIEDEFATAEQMIDAAANAIEYWLKHGIERAMSEFNGDVAENGIQGQSKQEQVNEQLKLAERAHELKPNDPRPLTELTRLYKKLRRLDDAVDAHLKLADVYRESDQAKQMLHEWEVAVKIRPDLTDVREEIAQAYEEQGNEKRAIHTWIKLGEYYAAKGDPEMALAAISEALRINPEHPKAVDLQLQYQERLTT